VFEHLDDPDPIAPGPAHRSAVARSVDRLTAGRRARRQRTAGAALAVVAVLGVGSVVAVRVGGSQGSRAALRSPGSAGVLPSSSRHAPSPSLAARLPQASADRAGVGAQSAAGSPPFATVLPTVAGCLATEYCSVGSAPLSVVNGVFRGPLPPAGQGTGKDGVCTGAEKGPPCATGVVTGRYYAATIPSGCGHPIVFDGRRWWSDPTTVVGGQGRTVHAWLRSVGPRSVEAIGGFGAVTLRPVAVPPAKACPSHHP
jgi:hypothetical protein